MLVVGLTGGIGSGKSTVATLFAERHVPIIDTDIIAREVTQPGQAAFTSIVKHFGSAILLQDGKLNRQLLRETVFKEAKQRIWLENLLHPIIRKKMEQQIHETQAAYCLVIIPLLFEVEFYSIINRILVVDAPEDLQIARAVARDNASQAEIEAILKTQASRKDRLSRAHDVIINDGKLEDLAPQVERLHELYLKLSAQASAK